jgi:mono/diheme cytochrome c family protein
MIVLALCELGQAQEPMDGAAIYSDYACFACHGYMGAGRTPLANGISAMLSSEKLFIAFLRQRADLNPLLPSSGMPNYSAETLSDIQARALYAYIKTFRDRPPSVEDNPVMLQILQAARAREPSPKVPQR